MAKHRRTWRPGRKISPRKPPLHSARRSTADEPDVPNVISNAVQEFERTTGLDTNQVLEMHRADDGGWQVVVEATDSSSNPGAEVAQYDLRLSSLGEIISCQKATREPQAPTTEGSAQPIPVDLGLRAELDTDIAISFRRTNLVNLRLRGSIRPWREGQKRRPDRENPA